MPLTYIKIYDAPKTTHREYEMKENINEATFGIA